MVLACVTKSVLGNFADMPTHQNCSRLADKSSHTVVVRSAEERLQPILTVSKACIGAHDIENHESLHLSPECVSCLVSRLSFCVGKSANWHVGELTTNHKVE